MAKQKTQVGADAVREWARAQGTYEGAFLNQTADGGPTRGRVPQSVIKDYEAATGNVYVAGFKADPTFTLTVVKRDKRGRKRTTRTERTRAQVLELAGKASNTKGVLSAATIADASAALSDPEPTPAEA